MTDTALTRFYHTYLMQQDSAAFIRSVSDHYQLSTLAALAQRGDVQHRRAAILSIGFLGDFSQHRVMGRALSDEDRGVRLAAESGIQRVWMAQGTVGQRRQLQIVERLLAANQDDEAMNVVKEVCRHAAGFGEAIRLRGVVNFSLGNFRPAQRDFRTAFGNNNFQYQVAIGLANCHLRLDDANGGLRWFRRALRINPDLELIRGIRAAFESCYRATALSCKSSVIGGWPLRPAPVERRARIGSVN